MVALADFVCNAGAVLGYLMPAKAEHTDALAVVAERISGLTRTTLEHPDGPFAGARAIAEAFLRSWRGEKGLPDGPPLA